MIAVADRSTSSMGRLFPLSHEQLVSLTRTCEQAGRAVWVEDELSRCVYRNARAEVIGTENRECDAFEIVDHEDRVVGRLLTART